MASAHFGVMNAYRPGKIRMVFDATAFVNGVSLNSQLLSGPDLNPSLPEMCGDIIEMFQRFLWREGDDSRRPECKRDIFHDLWRNLLSSCRPICKKYRNEDEHASDFPAAVEPIKTLHYVDDYVASFATAKEAAEVSATVTEVHCRGGFVLRNFVSNYTNVLRAIGASPLSSIVQLQHNSPIAADRILGMCWNTHEDVFSFQPSFSKIHEDVRCSRRPPTKREVLSIAMSNFDPFGLFADYMLHAKLIVQDLWRVGSGWDEPILAALSER